MMAERVMGLLLRQVSLVVLVCVVLLLGNNFGTADAAQTSDLFVDDESFLCVRQPSMHRCLHVDPIRLKDNATGSVYSFSTKFVITFNLGLLPTSQLGYGGSERNAVEGFTFAMLPDLNASLGGDAAYLGLLNATSNGDSDAHTFGVEFDFTKSPQFSDPDEGFHIGVDVNSMNSSSWAHLEGPRAVTNPYAWPSFWQLQVWIDYDASSQILNVSTNDVNLIYCPLPDPVPFMIRNDDGTETPSNSLSYQIDLSKVLNEHMYVGFTSNVDWNWMDLGIPFVMNNYWSMRTSNSSPAAPSAPLPCYQHHVPPYIRRHPFGITLALGLFSLTAMSAIYALVYVYYRRWVERRGWRFNIAADDLGDADPHKFTYRELAMATKNFDPKLVLGQGGFGSVYKGFLPGNQQYVAVKRVAPDSSQGEREFLAEVMIIGKIRHRNLVRLLGWCHEQGELLLVYDLMPEGSLDKHLFGPPVPVKEDSPKYARDGLQGVAKLVAGDEAVGVGFPWERRFKVVADVAKALVYLHSECEARIIHRDVKAANVMLDAKFNARLGDFGLARSYNHSVLTPESTNVAGTFGYFAPELFPTGKQTEQTDVYSFGAFLLEVACGKNPIFNQDGEAVLLVEKVWLLWGKALILDAADPRLVGMYDVQEMTKVLCLGLLCSHPSPALRPSMRQVLLILNGDVPFPDVPLSKPRFDYIQRSTPHNLSWTRTTNPSSMFSTASATGEESV